MKQVRKLSKLSPKHLTKKKVAIKILASKRQHHQTHKPMVHEQLEMLLQAKQKKPTRLVAITGGIASGKSTVGKIMQELSGWEVINADELYHQLIKPTNPLYLELIAEFGEEILAKSQNLGLEHDENNSTQLPEIDRAKLRSLVFGEGEVFSQNLKKLESITHRQILQKSIELRNESEASFIIWEVPLLFEAGWEQYADKVVVVSADRLTQKSRLRQRNPDLTDAEIENIFTKQFSDQQKVELADYVVINNQDASLEELKKKIGELIFEVSSDLED